MSWLIVRTDARKESYVAAQIAGHGHDAWVPAQMIPVRPHGARKLTAKAGVTIKELPILPRRVFVQVDWHEANSFASIRHVQGVERDGEERVILIPDAQVASFRAEIDRENTSALALAQARSRKQKAKWRSLQEGLIDLIDSAKQKMSQAA
jgi:hypothetical protein